MTPEVQSIEVVDGLGYELELEAAPAAVWRCWTEPAPMTRWMGDAATLEPVPGGIFRVTYKTGDAASGRYVEVLPPSRLVLTWGWEDPEAGVQAGGSRLVVDLEPLDDGTRTRLRMWHTDQPAEALANHDEGWRFFLPRLAEAAAEG